ncbi:MAG: hypothetical protein ACYCRF_12620 [Acidithiobacillus sp.]
MSELAIIPKESALTVFTTPKGLDPYLAQIRAEIDQFVPDLTTKSGREEIASMAYKVAKSKTYLESVGKELADAQKEIPKKIDAERKRVRDLLDAWKDEVRKPLTEYEAAEEARITAIKDDIAELQACAESTHLDKSSQTILDRLDEVKRIKVTEDVYQEYTKAVEVARDLAVASLQTGVLAAERREAEAAELAKLRAEAAARAQKDHEERIAREAAEKAVQAEQQKAKAAAEAVEREAKAAELRAKAEADAAARREAELKLQAERAEREKLEANARAERAEKEAQAKAEREAAEKIRLEAEALAKREADKAHKGKINRAAKEAFVKGGLTDEQATLAVQLIAKKVIPSIVIQY